MSNGRLDKSSMRDTLAGKELNFRIARRLGRGRLQGNASWSNDFSADNLG
jgi:hypothetical protein